VSFFTELRRRNVFKVGVAYAIVAWLVIQVADVVLPALQVPEWTVSFIAVLLFLGFPIAILLAWAYELTPEGIKAASQVQPSERITHATGLMLNYFIVGLLVFLVAFVVVDQYVVEPRANLAEAAGQSESTGIGPSVGVRRYTIDLESTEPMFGDKGLSAHLAFSSDGRLLVYAAQVEGEVQLYLRRLDQFLTRPIPRTEGAIHPFFSPDGEWVAFYNEMEGNLKRVSVRGGSPQPLADTGFSGGGSWELDDTIVFGTGDGEVGRNLYRLTENGGTPEILLAADTQGGYISPEVLPDGDAVLLLMRPGPWGSGAATEGNIVVLSLETDEVRTLVEGGYRPQYSPTGHIVFVRGGDLWAVPFDVNRLETTGAEALVINGVQQEGGLGDAAYAFTDTGILAYVPGGDVDVDTRDLTNLVWVDRQGREQPLGSDPRSYGDLRLSPDGRRLAVSVVEEGNWDIWILDLERGTSSRVTSDPETDNRPVWSHDGEHVVFRSRREGAGLYSRAANTIGQVTRLYSSPANSVAPNSFSPDGTQLVFQQFGQSMDLHVLSLADEPASQPLLQGAFDENFSAISPDGRWLAYGSDETGRYEVYIRPFPNVSDERWPISRDGASEPLWGPDGGELFYRGTGGIMAVSIETEPSFSAGSPRLLFPDIYTHGDGFHTSFDISPDGQRFLMQKLAAEQPEQNAVRTRLHIVENWFDELVRLAPPSD